MITNEQIIAAVSKSYYIFNEVTKLSNTTIDAIAKIFSSVDEEFMYNVFTRNDRWDREHDDYCELDRDFAVTIRSPKNYTQYEITGTHSICCRWTKGCDFSRAIQFHKNSSFTNYLLDNESDLSLESVADKIKNYPEFANEVVSKLIAKTKEMNKFKELLGNFNKTKLKYIAEYVEAKYNKAVELDRKTDDEFEALFGNTSTRNKVTITVTITVE